MITTHSRTVANIVEHYMDRRGKPQGIVSTRQAVSTIRMVVPQCTLSDRELADLVAVSAVRRGWSVAFDIGSGGHASPPTP